MDANVFGELDTFNDVIDSSLDRRLKTQLRKMVRAPAETICRVLTTASLIVSPPAEVEVLVFLENSSSRIRLDVGDPSDKPDLVAFFASRQKAEQVAAGSGVELETGRALIPPSHHLVSVVVTRRRTDNVSQCRRYLLSLSSHKPASNLQFGLAIDEDGFTLVALGLDSYRTWPKVIWNHPAAIRRLCACMKVIYEVALKAMPVAVSKLTEVIEMESWAIGKYTVRAGDELFRLLPIYSRGSGAKPFVALRVSEREQDLRVFKNSWYNSEEEWQEYELLKRLADVTGVVHLDERLSIDSIETNESNLFEDDVGTRTRHLLVLKTIGYPLCTCESVLEFLEAMYDLLEILRYLVQERNIMHRDVSWSNVLIRPAEHGSPKGSPKNLEEARDDGDQRIPHTYQFVSDIFKEDEQKFRAALADFDHGVDLKSCTEDDLKETVGTRIFMADDVLTPRFIGMPTLRFSMNNFTIGSLEIISINDQARHRARRVGTKASQSTRRSKSPIRLPVAYTIKPRRPVDESSTGKDFTCRRGGSNLRDLSEQDGFVLPVDRPREVPQRFLNKFDDPTERLWDIYWWKIRESLWFSAEKL
ncbi:hypothetical protein ACEPAH_1786 [Sanghuangporus vaninii]